MIENRMEGAAPATDHTPRTVGNGTYVLIEFGGPELSYMLARDEHSQKWHVNYTFFNDRSQMVLVLVGIKGTFWEAQDLASEDAQELWLSRHEA